MFLNKLSWAGLKKMNNKFKFHDSYMVYLTENQPWMMKSAGMMK